MTKKTKSTGKIVEHAQQRLKQKSASLSPRRKSKPVKLAKAKISTSSKLATMTKLSIIGIYWERFSSITLFALAGILVSLTAWQLVELSLTTTKEEVTFAAFGAHDYAAQQDFYTGQSTVTNPAQVAEKVHAAAESHELSQLMESLGVLLILAAVAWWQYRCSGGCAADFQIRKIRN